MKARAHCRVTHADEDDLFEAYVRSAESRCEDVTGRQLLSATWEAWLDRWPTNGIVILPRPNLQSVTSVTYLDGAGDLQTMSASDYVVEAPAGPHGGFGQISLAYGKSWPPVLPQAKAIQIRYVAGYGTADAVPRSIVQGLLLTIGTWWSNREDVVMGTMQPVPVAARQLWRPFHVR